MEEWTTLVSLSKLRRLQPSKFLEFTQFLYNKKPIPHVTLADLLLRPTSDFYHDVDTIIPLYVRALLKAELLDITAVLQTLLNYCPLAESSAEDNGKIGIRVKDEKPAQKWDTAALHDESTYNGLIKAIVTSFIVSGAHPRDPRELAVLIRVLCDWIKVLTKPVSEDDMVEDINPSTGHHATDSSSLRVAIGMVLVAMTESRMVDKLIRKKEFSKTLIKTFSQSLSTFTPVLMSASNTSAANAAHAIAERLDIYRTYTLGPLEPVDKKFQQKASAEMDKILDDTTLDMDSIPVVDMPIINSRAGLYVYLNSLLVGRPMVDTDALLQFLHNRYQGDTQTACIDLIISSFDIVANATFRNEPPATTFILRSFLTNKVPLLLVQMSTSLLGVANPEDIISQALSQVDTAALPSMSSMFDSDVGDVFGDSPKGEFCFACCLHGLLPEEATQRLLGEIVTMMSLPAGGLYKKEDLVQQCLNDPEKVETFAGELERMDGNVGAVSEALVAVIAQLADNRDTMTLKSLCSLIAKRPDSMSALLMFNRPVVILHPLVRLLDSWRYDDDQNEYQPVYEEFGSILLLILAFVGRFNLSPSDLSITTSSSFVSRLLSSGPQKRVLSTLSQQENEQIGGWISALFNAEGGGLSDETMARCPPQDFYMLVPCLFEQICAAVSQGYLTEDVLRGGLEYLVETFLLPALVPALKYLSAQLLSGGSEAATIIRVLNFLVTPASISSEARGMLDAVLHITARPLESSLRHLQVMEPRRQDVEPLSTTVRQYLAFPRTGAAEATEIENWTRGEHGGLEPTLRKAVQSLIAWAGTIAQTGGNANGQSPPSYTHRLVWFACRIWGAKYVMSILAEEAAEATKNGSGSVAIDAVAAMVCAPSPSGPTPLATPPRVAESQPAETTSRRTLRDALKADAERAGKIHKADPPLAETIVQLYRRVEALLAQPHPIHDPSVDMATVDMGTADMQAQMDISLSEPTQTLQTQQSASGNEMSLDHHSVNLDGMDLSMSSNPLGTQGSMDTAMAGLGGSADDLMAGMDTGELMSFDDLDEEMMRDF